MPEENFNKSFNICCTACSISLCIAALVFCILYAIEAKDNISYQYHLWYWCVIYGGMIALGIINTLVKLMIPIETTTEEETNNEKTKHHIKKYVYNYENPLDSFLRLAELGMFIWGCIIYSGLGTSGHGYNRHLWTWFQVMFWWLVVWMIITFCAFCCMGCTLCLEGFMMSQSSGSTVKTKKVGTQV